MKLFTDVPVSKSNHPIDYSSNILCLGSCFAEHMSDKLDFYKFQVVSNPFGILFHPKAILNVIEKAASDEPFVENDVFFHNDRWQSFFAHSRLNRDSSAEVLVELNSAKHQLKDSIINATHISITLGTSFVYVNKSSTLEVANCHKLPQNQFDKNLSSVGEIEKILNQLFATISLLNSNVNLVFTISPVRHLKDGFVENQRSKSHLLAALHQFLEQHPQVCSYFPSYELMMDELRDYRYYTRDLLHPNELAIDLIWDRFKICYILEDVYDDMHKVEKLQKSLMHRPSTSRGESYMKLKKHQLKLKKELESKYEFMSFKEL